MDVDFPPTLFYLHVPQDMVQIALLIQLSASIFMPLAVKDAIVVECALQTIPALAIQVGLVKHVIFQFAMEFWPIAQMSALVTEIALPQVSVLVYLVQLEQTVKPSRATPLHLQIQVFALAVVPVLDPIYAAAMATGQAYNVKHRFALEHLQQILKFALEKDNVQVQIPVLARILLEPIVKSKFAMDWRQTTLSCVLEGVLASHSGTVHVRTIIWVIIVNTLGVLEFFQMILKSVEEKVPVRLLINALAILDL